MTNEFHTLDGGCSILVPSGPFYPVEQTCMCVDRTSVSRKALRRPSKAGVNGCWWVMIDDYLSSDNKLYILDERHQPRSFSNKEPYATACGDASFSWALFLCIQKLGSDIRLGRVIDSSSTRRIAGKRKEKRLPLDINLNRYERRTRCTNLNG